VNGVEEMSGMDQTNAGVISDRPRRFFVIISMSRWSPFKIVAKGHWEPETNHLDIAPAAGEEAEFGAIPVNDLTGIEIPSGEETASSKTQVASTLYRMTCWSETALSKVRIPMKWGTDSDASGAASE
jgi:hypothetical protein